MNRTGKYTAAAFAVLVVNSLYLWSTAQTTFFYIANILAHFALGLALLAPLLWLLVRSPEVRRSLRWSAPALLTSAALGGYLLWKGALTSHHAIVVAHLATGFLGAFLVAVQLRSRRFWAVGALAAVVFAAYAGYQRVHPWSSAEVDNPNVVPTSNAGGGRGRWVASLAFRSAHEHRQDHPGQVLHGLEALRRVPQGDLRSVELLHAPLRLVQQPVLSQGHRAHAGRERNAGLEVVRRLPRPRDVFQRQV